MIPPSSAESQSCPIKLAELSDRLRVSAKGLEESAVKLEKGTGQRCLPLAADVREPAQLESAVKMTIDRYGKIDFVVCGMSSIQVSP